MSLECIRLRSRRNNIGLPDMKFRSVLEDDDALVIRNEISQNPEKGRLPSSCSAADEQRLPVRDLFSKEVCERMRQRTTGDQVVDGELMARELADRECWRSPHNGWNPGREPAPIWKLRMQ